MKRKVKCFLCNLEYEDDVFLENGVMNMKCPSGCSFVAIIENNEIIKMRRLFNESG